jgi:nitrogen fixation NifU-like protein
MMYDLQELYQEMVMDHGRKPRNTGKLDDATESAEGFNPLCGDQISVYLKVEDDHIDDVKIEAAGCAISKASASMMTEAIKGKTVEDAEEIFEAFRFMLTHPEGGYDAEALGDLEVLSGVVQYPARIKCALLPWHTLESALTHKGTKVSTE